MFSQSVQTDIGFCLKDRLKKDESRFSALTCTHILHILLVSVEGVLRLLSRMDRADFVLYRVDSIFKSIGSLSSISLSSIF